MYKRTHVDLRIVDVIEKANYPENTVELSKLAYNKINESLLRNREFKKYLKIPKWMINRNK